MNRTHNPSHPGALLQECLVGVSISADTAQRMVVVVPA
jgi:hypothetical protein